MSANLTMAFAALCVSLPAWLGGCSTAYFASSVQATDTSAVTPGVTAAVAREVLGAPIQEWRNPEGVTFRLYRIDGGRPARSGDAAAMAAFAVLTAGMSEFLFAFATKDDMKSGIPSRVIVAFDRHDVVLGSFGEFDYLPADGREPADLSRPRRGRKRPPGRRRAPEGAGPGLEADRPAGRHQARVSAFSSSLAGAIPGRLRSQVSCRFASCRVAAMPVSRRSLAPISPSRKRQAWR